MNNKLSFSVLIVKKMSSFAYPRNSAQFFIIFSNSKISTALFKVKSPIRVRCSPPRYAPELSLSPKSRAIDLIYVPLLHTIRAVTSGKL